MWRGSFLPGHRDVAGIYMAFANSDIAVNGLVTNAAATGYVQSHTGTLGLNGYSAGGYWTHYGPSGWYLDAVVQGTYYNGNAITQFANLPINGSGFVSSLEGGYPIPLPLGPRFMLEPQAQIIWQQVSFRQAMTAWARWGSVRPRVRPDGWACVGYGPSSATTVKCGSLTRAPIFGAIGTPERRRRLGSIGAVDRKATRLEFAGGVTAKLNPGVSVYAQAGYQFGLDRAFIRNGIQGDVGLRYVW